jgi:hypothetical protein
MVAPACSEEKQAKRLIFREHPTLRPSPKPARGRRHKSLLVLFFRKEHLPCPVQHRHVVSPRGMLEAIQATMGETDFWDLTPVILNVDAGGIRARRRLMQMRRSEQAQRTHAASLA